jgi:ABC-2 type transport system permease protein
LKTPNLLKRMFASIWLTWLESSNWTNPLVYMGYVLVRPIFSTLIYGYIYLAFALYTDVWNTEVALYVVGGSALYQFIVSGMSSVTWVVHEEREHYETLKYVYISHPNLQEYLVSRGLLGYALGLFLMAITILVGSALVGFRNFSLNVPLILVGTIMAVVWSSSLGALASAISLFSSEYGTVIAISFDSFLMIFGDVLFPSEKLPEWASWIAQALPLKDWMAMMRFAIFGIGTPDISTSILQQALKTAIIFLLSLVVFRSADVLIRKKGYIDITTEH